MSTSATSTSCASDDHSRLSLVAMAEDERQETAVAFLEQVVAHYCQRDVRVQRVMTDNGSAYRSRAFAAACRRLGVRHLYTALHAADQWQGRTLHPDRLARVGLCRDLPDLTATPRSAG